MDRSFRRMETSSSSDLQTKYGHSTNNDFSATDVKSSEFQPGTYDVSPSKAIDSAASEHTLDSTYTSDVSITADTLNQRLGQAIDRKEYVHWESPEAREQNRAAIDNYDAKKRAVDRASLMTQKEILTRYRECFDQDAIKRMHSELGSNKTEIYNEPFFAAEKAHDTGAYKVVGMRDVRDGKICIRDCENTDTLIHTSSHETMHDLSYQNADQVVSHIPSGSGDVVTISKAINYSGIFRLETTRNLYYDGTEVVSRQEANRYLNEGMTEMYTIEAMQARGEYPRFDSYTQEVSWALQLREKVGDDVFARAYFGGDVAQMESRVNSMSSVENAWTVLNENINAYHQSITWYKPNGDLKIKKSVDSMIADLAGSREYGSRGRGR